MTGLVRPILALLLLCLLPASAASPPAEAPGLPAADPPERTILIRIPVTDPVADLRVLMRINTDIPHWEPETGEYDMIGTPADLAALIAAGFDAYEARDLTPDESTIAALSDYLDQDETAQRLANLETLYPTLAKRLPVATTLEGRTEWVLKISDNVDLEEDEHAVFVVAQHHAREVMTPEIVLDMATLLLQGYGTDPEYTRFIDELEIWIVGSHNPDGTNEVFTGQNMWRKNRRDNGDGSFGVDPNRNYPFQWGNSRCSGSSSSTSSDTYHGPDPGSEPITQGWMQLAQDERPVINLSYHTYGELVIQSYGCVDQFPADPDYRTARDYAARMSARLVKDAGNGWYRFGDAQQTVNYEVDGEMNDWFYAELGSLGTTIEANASIQGFQPDYATWRDSTVDRNRPGWLYLLRRMDGPMARGHVTDACTGAPVEATLGIAGQAFVFGETPRTAEPVFGRWAWALSSGDYTFDFGHPGYGAQSWALRLAGVPVDREVRLVPDGERGVEVAGLAVRDDDDEDGQADPGETVTLDVTVYATGGPVTGLTATLTTTDPYLTVVDGSASYPPLAAGEQGANLPSDAFSLSVSPAAPDGHEAVVTVTFSSPDGLCSAGGETTLRLTRGFPSCPSISEPLDADPGWTIENGGADGWEFGTPQGTGGYGGPPTAHTGSFVYATNLDGNYGANADYTLTAGPYDLSGLRNTELRFWRWLNSQAGEDLVTVEVSADGTSWTEVERTFGRDPGWTEYRFDISAVADLEEAVSVRFRLSSDASSTRSGFYLDDLSLCGEEVPSAKGKLRYDSHVLADADPNRGNGDGSGDTGETLTLEVTLRSNRDLAATDVHAFLSTTEPTVSIRNGYAEFPDVPAGGIGDSLGPHFTFTVDSECRQTIPFVLETFWDGGQSSLSTFSVPVGESETVVLLDDDFETDQGWTTGAGGASAGFWVREDPYGVDGVSGPVQPEDDTTPDPGITAWITDNPRPRGSFSPADGDVDGGAVDLVSPAFDGFQADSLELSFSRWFHVSAPSFNDSSRWTVGISTNGGSSFGEVESLSANSSAWTPVTLELNEFLVPSATMQLRFRVEEERGGLPGDTLLEGLVDDVRLVRQRRECELFTPPALNPPNTVGATVLAAKEGSRLRLDWTAPPADATHDAATSYRVYRSGAPSGGFAETAAPTAPFLVERDGALPGAGSLFYLVASENSGGLSGEQP